MASFAPFRPECRPRWPIERPRRDEARARDALHRRPRLQRVRPHRGGARVRRERGIKKAEKIDYASLREGKPILFFECKAAGTNLDTEHASQLFRYYHVTKARIGVLTNGVLTNGVIYRFLTDLEEPNKMDAKQFLEVNLLELHPAHIEEIKRFAKTSFNIDDVLSAAVELKYTKEIKRLLSEQMETPSEEIVRFFTGKVYGG